MGRRRRLRRDRPFLVRGRGEREGGDRGHHPFFGDPSIKGSKLSATGTSQNVALQQLGGDSTKVALSQLVGGVLGDNTLQCFDNYDENPAPVNCRSVVNK